MNSRREDPLIEWSKPHKIFLFSILLIFIVTTILGIHGFSTPEWKPHIDNAPKDEILLNHSRDIRTDDWLVNMAMIFSQIAHDPPFPSVNKNIGLGQNMFGHPEVPIAHPVAIFRPWSWGYFFDRDMGMAWHWNFRELGLLYSSFLVFMLLSRNAFIVSLGGSFLITFSTFAQYWSLSNANVQTTAMLCVVFTAYTLFSEQRWKRVLTAVLLGWSGGCFVNTIYPPFQVPMAYAYLALTAAVIYQQHQHFKVSFRSSLGLMLIALSIFIFASACLYAGLGSVISLLANTAYPGQRFTTGGNLTLLRMSFNMLIRKSSGWGEISGSICEGAGFILLSAFFIPAVLLRSFLLKKLPKFDEMVVISVMVFMLIFLFLGFPAWLARASLLSYTTEERAIIGLGIFDASLIVVFVKNMESLSLSKKHKLIITVGSTAVLFLFLGSLWLRLGKAVPHFSRETAALWIIILVSSSLLIIYASRFGMATLLVASFVNTSWFNPRVKGGADYLMGNPLSKKILEIKEETGSRASWVVFGGGVGGNLIRMLGAKSLAGVYFHPQFDLWRKFDPSEYYKSIYNRYAHIYFRATSGLYPSFTAPYPDNVIVTVDPDDKIFKDNYIDYILVSGEYTDFDTATYAYDRIFSYHNHHIYKRH